MVSAFRSYIDLPWQDVTFNVICHCTLVFKRLAMTRWIIKCYSSGFSRLFYHRHAFPFLIRQAIRLARANLYGWYVEAVTGKKWRYISLYGKVWIEPRCTDTYKGVGVRFVVFILLVLTMPFRPWKCHFMHNQIKAGQNDFILFLTK